MLIQDEFALILRTSIVDGTPVPIMNLTSIAHDWRRYDDWVGGAHVGEFIVYSNDPEELMSYFNSWLGLDFAEVDGGLVTWNGRVMKLDFIQGNMPKSRDLSRVHNKVRAQYDNDKFTDWSHNLESQELYGIREFVLSTTSDSSSFAQNERSKHLQRYGMPNLFSAQDTMGTDEYAYGLRVYVAGYKTTFNDFYAPTSIVKTTTIASALETMITTNAYISKRFVDANTNQIISAPNNMRGWDFISKLLTMTDSNNALFRGWVDSDIDGNKYFSYESWDMTPSYYIKDGFVYLSPTGLYEVHPRYLSPGIYRDLDSVIRGSEPGSIFQDRSDILIERIYVDEYGVFSYETAEDSWDYMNTLGSNIRAKRSSGGKKRGRSKWRWKKMSEGQRKWWLGGKKGKAPDSPD